MILRAAAALLLLGSPALARMPGYTVSEVWKDHVALHGQIIRVSGVLTRCERLSCSLRENIGPDARSLGLGSSDRFDDEIQSRLGMPLVIEGRFDATCLHAEADRAFGEHGLKDGVVCLDRASMLRDPKIVSNR